MKISVVIPVFNTKAEYLMAAVKGVLTQSFPCHELIIVNDGSTRQETIHYIEGLEYCEDYYDCISTIKVINQKNKKISGALNAGIWHMTGDWWAGCGSDDRWHLNKLGKQVEFIKKHPEAKVIYCDWQFINEDGSVTGIFNEPEFTDRKEAGRYIIHDHFATWSGMMIHRSVFENVGLFDESYPTREDYEFNIRILTKYLMYRVPKVLFQYRVHPEQLTRRNDRAVQNFYTEKARAVAIEYFGEKNEH